MAVRFYTFDRVISVEAKLFKHLLINFVVERHELFLGKKTFLGFVLELAVPRVLSYVVDRVTILGLNF